MLLIGGTVLGQNRVLHVWVDPHNGDDTAAAALLPPNVQCSATDSHPHNILESGGSSPLQHASAPFRTVTAAIGYIQSIHPSGLPATQPNTNVTTEQVVIHCLPGLYGPAATDPHTGLLFNGETLPILLPERVSIQGANALNTVFVSDGQTGVFVFGQSGNAFGEDVEGDRPVQYLANIAITGAIRDDESYGGVPEQGAAIFVDSDRRVSLLVTDCVLYDNATAVLVDNFVDEVNVHAIHLINNTFAWNVCGIWSGAIDRNANPAQANASVGASQLGLINNVFDTLPPIVDYTATPRTVEIPLFGRALSPLRLPASWVRWIATMNNTTFTLLQGVRMTAFEGVDASDLLVASTPQVDYNAYEANRWNGSSATLGALSTDAVAQMTFLGLHQTSERSTRGAGPSRGIGGITGEGSQQRGILFVRDLLHEGGRNSGDPFNVGGNADFDRCLGDFRLAPAVLAAGNNQGTPPDTLNPLVDAGLTFVDDANGVPTPVAMGNGLSVTPYPFLGNSEDEPFPPSPSEWDLEGFGNPRAFDHPAYVSTPTPIQGVTQTTDLGADELDLLVMAGYRETTTTFIANAVTLPSSRISENDLVWFLCPVEGLTGSAFSGGTVPQTGVYHPIHSDYPARPGWSPAAPANYYFPTDWLDTVPHLLPDVHPWWWLGLTTPSHIEWRSCLAPPPQAYNPTLYMNPLAGIINPIGAAFTSPTSGVNWLDEDAWIAYSPGGVWSGDFFMFEGVSTGIVLFNDAVASSQSPWCAMHDGSGAVATVNPSLNPRIVGDPSNPNAMRVSCEFVVWPFYQLFQSRGSNLQSFLIWSDD